MNRVISAIDITSDPGGNGVVAYADLPEGGSDVQYTKHVVAKVSTSGEVRWSYRRLPHIKGLATDKDGSVHVAGVRLGPSADPIPSDYFQSVGITPDGTGTAYVAKLSSEGVLQWVRQFGGSNSANAQAVAVTLGPDGDYYVVGQYRAGTVIAGQELRAPSSTWGVYVAKFAPDGQAIWVRTGSGSSPDLGLVPRAVRSSGFKLDRFGNLNVRFQQFAPFLDDSGSVGTGAYFARFDPNGRVLLSLPTPEQGPGTSDDDGNLFTAAFVADVAEDTGNLRVRKYTGSGDLVWMREAHVNTDYTLPWFDHRVVTDRSGNCIVGGYFYMRATDVAIDPGQITFGDIVLTAIGFSDGFAAKYSSTGELRWAVQSIGQGAAYWGYSYPNDISAVSGFLIAPTPQGDILFTAALKGSVSFGDTILESPPSSMWRQPQFFGRLVEKAEAPPVLSISRHADEIVLSWEGAGSGVVVETAPTLPVSVWTAVTEKPVIEDSRSVLRLRADSAARFYRLARQ